MYRSNILSILFQYISREYEVKNFGQGKVNYNEYDNILRQAKRDEEFLSLFCFIIFKRLIILDDIEFQGKNKQPMQYPFIPFNDIRYVS